MRQIREAPYDLATIDEGLFVPSKPFVGCSARIERSMTLGAEFNGLGIVLFIDKLTKIIPTYFGK